MIKNLLRSLSRPRVEEYRPAFKETPPRLLDCASAWKGHELIVADLIRRFGLETRSCLEFGVEFGYSTVAFSNYFAQVTGVDTFEGDIHTTHKGDHYELTKASLAPYSNIRLVRSDYRDFIAGNSASYDLIHVDLVHTYEVTFDCGLWSVAHSACTIFHDTESFPEVRRAVADLARRTGKKAYNYPPHFGLGIVV